MPGYTQVYSPAGMAQPAQLTQALNGGPILSLSIGNVTSRCSVVVYPSSFPGGAPLYTVPPGQFITLPLSATANLCLVFTLPAGAAYDGSVFVHTDPTALSVSGFAPNAIPNIYTYTTLTAAAAVPCYGLTGLNAQFFVGVINNSFLAQPVTVKIFDAAAPPGTVVIASIDFLGPTQIITWPPPGFVLAAGCVAQASGVPNGSGIQVLTR